MTPLPTPRGAEDVPGAVLGIVVESLRRLEDSVGRLSSDMNGQLSRLPELYVPRRELDRRFEDLAADVAEGVRKVTSEETDRRADVEKLRNQWTAARRYAITTVVGGLSAATAVVAVVLTHR